MKKAIIALLFVTSAFVVNAQEAPKKIELKDQTVEASCGTCNFKLKGKECELAVKIKGTAYFVDGTGINDHGDAHSKTGFCNAVRKAKVTGTVENGRFKATAFKLVR